MTVAGRSLHAEQMHTPEMLQSQLCCLGLWRLFCKTPVTACLLQATGLSKWKGLLYSQRIWINNPNLRGKASQRIQPSPALFEGHEDNENCTTPWMLTVMSDCILSHLFGWILAHTLLNCVVWHLEPGYSFKGQAWSSVVLFTCRTIRNHSE